jgi:hypothetical protein
MASSETTQGPICQAVGCDRDDTARVVVRADGGYKYFCPEHARVEPVCRAQALAVDRSRRLHDERVGRDERAAALALRGAEPLMNGRCVGHVELDERFGTVLVMDWHDPAGCEHEGAAK